jgi:hypothetical protein
MAGGTAGKSTKDLVLSLVPLVALVLLVAGVAGMCSFSPGGPQTDRSVVRTVDAAAELARMAQQVGFPVRSPRLPDGWQANSFGLRPVGEPSGPRAVRVGWLLPAGGYLRLVQSDAAEADLVRSETEQPAAAFGAVDVHGVTWVRYPSLRREQAWVAELSGVRVLITGSADEPDFRTLAGAVQAAPPLPSR